MHCTSMFLVLAAPYRTLTMAFCVSWFYVYYPHLCVDSQQEDEPSPLAVDTPKPDNTTPASDNADGASTLPVNTAGTSAASQGAHLSKC